MQQQLDVHDMYWNQSDVNHRMTLKTISAHYFWVRENRSNQVGLDVTTKHKKLKLYLK